MFRKVLIANRGEIACRVARTLQIMDIGVVAVYSDADRAARHVGMADEAYALAGNTPAETYLRGDAILEIARQAGVDAIHPGYGFLSENAKFAAACRDAGIAFIGPTPEAIRAVGDKIAAKRTMSEAGVPVAPGWMGEGTASAAELRAEAARIGYPLLVKAAAGGGGKGMRRVEREADLSAAAEAASREAQSAFSDRRIFLEKYLERPRHVEVQIIGDSRGEVVHLFERECSIQRRFQKLIEETPCTAVDAGLREQLGSAAVRAARAIGYTNAGTVEFLLDSSGAFYFLEVNTRLQVEHPITEMTLRCDLVRAQVMVAAGEGLPFVQSELRPEGHAIECRICAEKPAQSFLPATGTIRTYVEPTGPNIRVDSGVGEGSEVTAHYDSLLAKLVTLGSNRDEAIARMCWALERFVILGVATNIEFLRATLGHPEFRAGRTHTHFLTENPCAAEQAAVTRDALVVAAWAVQDGRRAGVAGGANAGGIIEAPTPWQSPQGWRSR